MMVFLSEEKKKITLMHMYRVKTMGRHTDKGSHLQSKEGSFRRKQTCAHFDL